MGYLVCKCCGRKELITNDTVFRDCSLCKAPRYAEDEKGNALIVFTKIDNPLSWDLEQQQKA